MPRTPPDQPPTRPIVEELESRVLLSADLQPIPLDLPDSGGADALVERVELLSQSQADAAQMEVAREEVVFIDGGVADRETLVADLQRAAGGRSLEIVLLDADSDGVRQISDFLADREGLDAIHLISHGEAGSLQLGSTWLDGAGLLARSDEIAAWGDALTSDADLLLYGCDLAGQPDGAALVESLAKLTGADVAASVDRTGDGSLGGDWDLEYHSGVVETSAAVDASVQWSGALANQPPVNTVPGTQTTSIDTQLLFSDAAGNGVSLDDPDAAGEMLELRLVVTNGTLTLIGPSDSVDVNSVTSNVQTAPRVARDAAGNTLVVWTSQDQDGDGFGIYAQRFDASGNAIDSEFQVNTETLGDQVSPAVAMSPDGGFVIAWQSDGQDGDSWGIYGQRFDAAGNAVGGEFQVNSETAQQQTAPAIAMDAAGNFVVAWQSQGQDGSGEGIYAQRFDASGNALGGEFQVHGETLLDQAQPAVAMGASGDFVVVWQSDGQDGDSWGIYGRRFDASGNAVGGEFQVSSEVTGAQASPAIAMDAAGDFVVAWQSQGQDGSSWGVYAQRYDASGASQGGEFQVNTTTNQEQSSPSVAMDADGDFAIAWQGLPGNFDIYVQQYASDGTPIGGETQVNAFTGGDQKSPDIAMDADGDQFVVWEGKTGGGTSDEISGGNVSFAKNLTFVSGDGTDDSVIIVRGTLADLNQALDGMVFTPTSGFEGLATIEITANDLGHSGGPALEDTDCVDIIVGDANVAPVLDTSGDLVLSDVTEDDPDPPGDSVASLLASAGGDPISDADGDPEGIAVVGVDDSHGSWQFSTDGGGSWQGFGAVSDSAAVLLDAGARIRFVPDADYAGPAGELHFRAWDQSVGSSGDVGHAIDATGGATAFSGATETATLDVTPVNDAPTQSVPGPQSVASNGSLVFSGSSGNPILVADVDASVVQITLSASQGTVTLASVAGLTFGAGDGVDDAVVTFSGSLADVNAALDGLRFDPAPGFSGSAGIAVTTDDLGGTGAGGSLSVAGSVPVSVIRAESQTETAPPTEEQAPPPLDPQLGPSSPITPAPAFANDLPAASRSDAAAVPAAPGSAEREHGVDLSERSPGPMPRPAGLVGATGQLDTSLDRLRQDLTRSADDERSRGETIFAGFRAAALAASTGALAALLRGGSLLALTFSSLPVWKGFDPLAVLALSTAERQARKAAQRAEEEQEDEAVARMFEDE